MFALWIATGPDTGGQGSRAVKAFQRYGDRWEVRSVAKLQQYMAYEPDLPFRRDSLEDLYQRADVIHVRNRFDEYDRLADKFGPKALVLHVHGSLYRADPHKFLRQARERHAIVACSTLDLWLIAPDESVWLPSPFDVDSLAEMVESKHQKAPRD